MSAFVCTARELGPVMQETATAGSIALYLPIALSNPTVYFYGNLYNEPNLKMLVDCKDSTSETKSLFALVEILAFGQSSDLQRLLKDRALCAQLGVDASYIAKVPGVVRKLHFLTLLSLFSRAVHGNHRRVSHSDIAVAVGGDALEADGTSPNIRYVEDLVLDIMAAEIATCRINHMDKYIEVRNFQVRDIPPVESELKFVKLEHSGKEQIAAMFTKLDQCLKNCENVCNDAGTVDTAVKNRQDYISQRTIVASNLEQKHIIDGINEEKALEKEVDRRVNIQSENRKRHQHRDSYF